MQLTNNELKNIKKLKDKKYRRSKGLFLVEGEKLCGEALNSKLEIVYTITNNSEKYKQFPKIVDVKYEVLESICTTDTPQDIVCVCKILPKNMELPKGNSLVLDGLQDPGNIGTLVRSAIAFNFKDVYFIDCPDIYSEKVIRSTMGGMFKINAHVLSRQEFVENKNQICDILIGTSLNGEKLNKNYLPNQRISVIIGNEGNGISETLLNICDKVVTLPMSGEIESLNASVAGGIMMYEIFNSVND